MSSISSSNRLYEDNMRIKQKKEDLREKYLNEEKQKMRNKPFINEKSKLLLSSENKKPLFLRVEQVQKRRTDEINKIKHVLQSQQKEKEPDPTFTPDISMTKKKEEKKRSVPQFLNDIEEWGKKKKSQNEKLHLTLLTEEMKENTFHPQLDKNSMKLVAQVFFKFPFKKILFMFFFFE